MVLYYGFNRCTGRTETNGSKGGNLFVYILSVIIVTKRSCLMVLRFEEVSFETYIFIYAKEV